MTQKENPTAGNGGAQESGGMSKGKYNRQARAWARRPWMDCRRHTDVCRCEYTPSLKQVDAYAETIAWLEDHGLAPAALLPECRGLWSRGGNERAAAERVVRQWAA